MSDRNRIRKVALDNLEIHTNAINSPAGTWTEATIRRFEDELVEAIKQYAVISGQTALEAMIELQSELPRKGYK